MFRDRIKATYDALSPSYHALADYILEHPFETAFMNATQLARRLGVDTATVVRFAQRLDYPGWPELSDEVCAEVKEQLAHYFEPRPLEEDETNIFRASLHRDATNVERFTLTAELGLTRRLMKMINQAERIVVMGEGLSEPLADLLARGLRLLLCDAAVLVPTPENIALEFRTLTSRSLVVGIAVSSFCPDLVSAMHLAHAQGTPTLALVGGQSWPVARAADLDILCAEVESERIPSLTSFALAITAILRALEDLRRDKLAKPLEQHEDLRNRFIKARGRANPYA